MHAVTQTDPIEAFNRRAKAAGWTLTCGPAQGFQRPELVHALALWREKAAGRSMPMRSDMTARALKPYLTHMSLLERVDTGEGSRYRVRLHGTALAGYGGDKTGQFLDQVIPSHLVGGNVGLYETVLELLQPLRAVCQFQSPHVNYLVGETLLAPLSVTGQDMPIILSITYVESRSKATLKV